MTDRLRRISCRTTVRMFSHDTTDVCLSPEAFPSGVVISIITCVGSDAWDRLVVIKTRIVLFIRELL